MKNVISKLALTIFLLKGLSSFGQEDAGKDKSHIQTYTPSKLLDKGQWDIKFFNNLYTETSGRYNGVKLDKARETYFTSTLDIFMGVSDNNRFNIGLLLAYRSNVVGGRNATAVFEFSDDVNSRNGLSSIAPAIKWQPIEGIGHFSIQSAFHIPIIANEKENGVFLDQTAYTFQNRFFYDYTLPSGDWQLFTELNTAYSFGNQDSFANKTIVFVPGVFVSYFPSDKSTLLGFAQHSQRFGNFTQDYTALGFGGKYQLTEILNLEVLYSSFIRGDETGLGQSFNIGLRALF